MFILNQLLLQLLDLVVIVHPMKQILLYVGRLKSLLIATFTNPKFYVGLAFQNFEV